MMKKRRTPRRKQFRRRGTAIVEFTLALPLLALVLLLTYSFGWAMTNQQRVWAADRYACWKQVRTGVQTSRDQINQSFFNGRANGVSVNYNNGYMDPPPDALHDYVADVSAASPAAGSLAQGLIFNRYPLDEQVTIQADFPTKNLFWKYFSGAMQSRDFRAGVEWRWRQWGKGLYVGCENEVANQRLPGVDNTLVFTPAPGDVLARFFRSLYRETWQYHDWPYGSDGNLN